MTDTTNTESVETTPFTTISKEEREAIDNMPYEQARDRLIEAVRALEAGGLTLDDSMKQWELGEALAQRAQYLLQEVRNKLTAVQEEQAQTANTAGTQSNIEAKR